MKLTLELCKTRVYSADCRLILGFYLSGQEVGSMDAEVLFVQCPDCTEARAILHKLSCELERKEASVTLNGYSPGILTDDQRLSKLLFIRGPLQVKCRRCADTRHIPSALGQNVIDYVIAHNLLSKFIVDQQTENRES